MPHPHPAYPIGPLLAAFRAADPPRVGLRRDAACRAARADWLNAGFLDTAPAAELAVRLTDFYRAVLPVAWHDGVVAARAGVIRHGVNHLLHGQDPLPARFARCVEPGGAYFVPGLGPAFWAALVKGLDPDRHPDLRPAVRRGLATVGAADVEAALATYAHLLSDHTGLTASDLDRFFVAVAGMRGRELGSADDEPGGPAGFTRLLRALRSREPLKRRTADHAGRAVWYLVGGEGEPPVAADAVARLPDLFDQLDRVRSPDDLPDALDDGLWLAAGVLHLRHPARFPLWTDAARRGLDAVTDAARPGLRPPDQYRLLCDVAGVLRQQFRAHQAEVEPLLASAAADTDPPPERPDGRFDGFSSDTFRFLADLGRHNSAGWMAAERDRYRFAVREPMVELCAALGERYVRPVLRGEYGWDLETDPRPGRALSSICKNDFGRSGPYVPEVWAAFYRRGGHKRDDAQLAVRLGPGGVACGFRLGRRARDAGRRFRRNVQEHGELLFAALRATGAVEHCRFGTTGAGGGPVRSPADLREWAAGKDLFAGRLFPPDAAVLRSDDLVGEALIAFDRLVPLFAAAVEDDPRPVLARRAGAPDGRPGFDREAFRSATFLSDLWLTRALDLLALKKQLVLQGVPGTGKTHVARSLARLLTGDRGGAVQLVQFHPGYSYEEFVEGIRPKAADGAGGAVTYPVEPGLLTSFAERAARHPADPHVLVIDELNRGNLPRVFGELLFLLEYRDQEVTLPYSKRPFRLPANLYLVATMNPADRSAVGLDQALRRRFSFVDMPPDPVILARWLDAHPPADPDPTLAARLATWFEDLNRRLARDAGPDRQVGHSFFMVPDLTADKLRQVWDHHVRPLLAEAFPGGLPSGYDIRRLLSPPPEPRPVRGRPAVRRR